MGNAPCRAIKSVNKGERSGRDKDEKLTRQLLKEHFTQKSGAILLPTKAIQVAKESIKRNCK
jgi:hypothetical protein